MVLSDAQANRPTLLLTRPQPQSLRFATELRHRFGTEWRMVISPLMQMRFLAPAMDPSAYAGVIFSSETGVAAVAALMAQTSARCYCVGQRTATAARAQGWNVMLTGPDAVGLAAAIIAAGTQGPLLHFHGQHVAGNLTQGLISAGIETVSAVIYDQQAQPPTPEMLALLAGFAPVLVPLFSPRAAQLFRQAASGVQAPLWVAALSPAVAEALSLPVARLVVAARPDGDAMLDAVAALLPAKS